MTFCQFRGNSLTEARILLSATRFAVMAAAICQSNQLHPIVTKQQADFLSPGLGASQVGEKGPGIGTGMSPDT